VKFPERLRPRFFYGWWITVIGLVMNSLASGTYWTGATVFFLPITRDLGLDRAATSMAFALARLEGGLGGPFVGYLVDRFGPRRMALFGGVMSGVGFLLLSQSRSYAMFLVIYVGVLSVGFNAGFNHAVMTAVNSWFVRRRGMAMAVIASGVSLGGAVITPLVAYSISQWGWRTGAIIAGTALVVTSIPLSYFIRSSPEIMGLLPDGDERKPIRSTSSSVSSSPTIDFTAMEAIKTPSYWFLALAIGLRIAAHAALVVHLVPILVWKGQAEVTAPLLVGIMSFTAVPLRFVTGYLSDVWSRQKVAAVGMAMGGGSVLVLIVSDGAFWQLIVFVVMLGFAESVSGVSWSLIGDFFGRTSFATLRGGVTTVHSVLSMGMPVYAGVVFDRTDSYFWALVPIVGIYTMAALSFWLLPKPAIPARLAGHVAESEVT
jgi:MFS family permease